MPSAELADKTILVVEDEALIALDLEGALCDAGANVLIATTVHKAADLIERSEISAALVDYKLRDGMTRRTHKAANRTRRARDRLLGS